MTDEVTALGLLEDDAIILDAAALELAHLDHPERDLAPYVEVLSAMTDRLAAIGADAQGAGDRAAALAQVIGAEFGFTGDRQEYDAAENADLIRVIDRRMGLPVSLAILYVAAARRLGWTADALNTPGHVLVRIGSEAEALLIDPFGDGRTLGAGELVDLLSRMLGRPTTPVSAHLEPLTNRAVLVRLLLNQSTRAELAGDLRRALTLFDRMTRVAPAHSHGWWDRARLQIAFGDASGARASLSALLEVTRDPSLRLQAQAAIGALSATK